MKKNKYMLCIDNGLSVGKVALVSGIGIGIYKDEKEAYQRTYHTSYVCEPDMNNKVLYDDYYHIFKNLYPDLKNINNNIYERFRK